MISLSTAWNADRSSDGAKIAAEIDALGFSHIELNFSLTRDMVDGIVRYADTHNLHITSLHNYCPTPPEFKREKALPDCFSLSSLKEDERKKAVVYTKRSIQTARQVNARAVVLHCGRVEIPDRTRELIGLAVQGRKNSAAATDMRDAFIAERKNQSHDYFTQLLKSLEECADYAQEENIALGIENRFYYHEIPSLDEFAVILERFKDKPVGYWHDTGHAFVMEQLGFIPEGALLKRYAGALIGTHLHNVKNLVDHQDPLDGDTDLCRLASVIKKDAIMVIEVHSHVNAEAIRRSARIIEEAFHD